MLKLTWLPFPPVRALVRTVVLLAGACLIAGPTGAADAKPVDVVPPPLAPADDFRLAIPKKGFGHDYLLSASIIPQGQAATSHGLAGRIVRFELFADGVDLYESTRGLVVTEDLPARRLLANFPIVRQDADQVVIDFNRGMRRVFTLDWTEGGGLDLTERDRVLEVPEARVFEMRLQDTQLVVRQSVQLRDRKDDPNLEARFEVRYFIQPYRPGDFAGKEQTAPDTRYARFFETEGQYEPITGRIASHIVRFDLRQPVLFHYSANTPAAYESAVQDGITYWNRVFGREVVQARKAPDGVTAPDSRYNVIQWVPWDNAGFAYADVLMDPRTGQSQHGQAYITSVFAFSGKARARALLRAMRELAEPKKDDKKGQASGARLGVPFLASAPGCQIDPGAFAAQYARGLEEVLAADELTDEAVLRASQDYVRNVVAHEVGHVLGLRHNFAGSLAATVDHKNLDAWFKDYIAGQPLDAYTNQVTTSSIMEYTVFKAAIFAGWKMRATTNALPHDLAAIRWGYLDQSEPRDSRLLFATDQDVGRYGDVERFDYGTEPVVAAYAETANFIERLPNNVIELFIAARAPRNPRDRVPLETVNLNPRSYASGLATQFGHKLQWFRADARSLKVENTFDFIGELNRRERHQAHWKSLNDQLDRLGGVDRAVFSAVPLDLKLELKKEPVGVPIVSRLSATNLTARLEKLLETPAYTNFVGLDDQHYTFTKEEKELIVKRGKRLFEELENAVLLEFCQRLENAPRDLSLEANEFIAEDDAVSRLEQRIIELAKLVVNTRDDTKRIKGKVDKALVEVVDFKYDQELRLAAAKVLNEKTGSFKSWATEAKGELHNQLKGDVESALNIANFKAFQPSMLSRPLREWYQRQQDLLNLLPPPPNPTPH